MLANCLIRPRLAILFVLALPGSPPVPASEPGPPQKAVAPVYRTDTVRSLVARLDSASFSEREAAKRDLQALLLTGKDQSSKAAATLFQLSLDSRVSFEAQQCLKEILDGLEQPGSLHSPVVSEKDIKELITHLSDDHFTIRETAIRRLSWWLQNPANIVPAMQAIKTCLADTSLPAFTRQELTRHYDTVRRAWLLAPAKDCPLPPVGDAAIAEMIATVAAPANEPNTVAKQQLTIRELEDLLCREEYREAVTTRISKALEGTTDPATMARLRELADLARPAMVAEIWASARFINLGGGFVIGDGDGYQVRLATMQYLHIGVPQVPENALRATFFDRCDDKTAHCVSGNTLRPGDYPVGTAILHPDGEMTLFHLINLPTPRRRLIYEYSASTSEVARLRALSQKTCDAYLSKARPLTNSDVSILVLLDRSVVADFAGRYFQEIDDAPLTDNHRSLAVGPASLHGAVCYALAITGTKDAAPAIIKAIEKKRFLPLADGRRYDLPYLALLSIARRDPWKNSDDWLGTQLSKQISLVADVDPAPDLAATAAAILLERHGKSIDDFGLEANADIFCQQIRLPAYHFRDDASRQSVLRWWLGTREIARATMQ